MVWLRLPMPWLPWIKLSRTSLLRIRFCHLMLPHSLVAPSLTAPAQTVPAPANYRNLFSTNEKNYTNTADNLFYFHYTRKRKSICTNNRIHLIYLDSMLTPIICYHFHALLAFKIIGDSLSILLTYLQNSSLNYKLASIFFINA